MMVASARISTFSRRACSPLGAATRSQGEQARRLNGVARQRRGIYLRRRGAIFITALGIIVILAALALTFTQSMRTEAEASANRLAQTEADAVERGAEQWVLAQTEAYPGDAVTITQVPAEAVQVGNGYFWILHPDPTQDQQYKFGIMDECSKLSINLPESLTISSLPGSNSTSIAATEYSYLPNMTQPAADDIVAWLSQESDPNGSNTNVYSSLQEPYESKEGYYGPGIGYESPEELLLLQNMTPQILYGSDLNHNGVIEPSEQTAASANSFGGMGSPISSTSTNDSRGIFNYITCFSKGMASSATPAGGSASGPVNINPVNLNQLGNLLQNAGVSSGNQSIIESYASTGTRGNVQGNTFRSITSFYTTCLQPVNLPAQQLAQVLAGVTVGGAGAAAQATPQVNVNTAPLQVLNALLWENQGDAQSIIDARAGQADTTDTSWFLTTLLQADTSALANGVLDQITGQSYQYSADIVAVSADGRAFRRVRIVVDASGMATNATTQTPAQIIYRKDLTSLGWPLDPQIRAQMRAGQQPADINSNQNTITY